MRFSFFFSSCLSYDLLHCVYRTTVFNGWRRFIHHVGGTVSVCFTVCWCGCCSNCCWTQCSSYLAYLMNDEGNEVINCCSFLLYRGSCPKTNTAMNSPFHKISLTTTLFVTAVDTFATHEVSRVCRIMESLFVGCFVMYLLLDSHRPPPHDALLLLLRLRNLSPF